MEQLDPQHPIGRGQRSVDERRQLADIWGRQALGIGGSEVTDDFWGYVGNLQTGEGKLQTEH